MISLSLLLLLWLCFVVVVYIVMVFVVVFILALSLLHNMHRFVLEVPNSVLSSLTPVINNHCDHVF